MQGGVGVFKWLNGANYPFLQTIFKINAMPRRRQREPSGEAGGVNAQLPSVSNGSTVRNKPAAWWILTIPVHEFIAYLPSGVDYLKGQIEEGDQTGYRHWQVVVHLRSQQRLSWIKKVFGDAAHAEPTRSAAALDYVWKDETRVDGTQIDLGKPPFCRNDSSHWDKIKEKAKEGRLDEIDSQVYICHYNSLKKIMADNMKPVAQVKVVKCFWGPTGVGKSRRAWEEAGINAYPKISTTKWWDGYRPEEHENVVIDEFTGSVDILHMLRWLDRYPQIVETKGSSIIFKAKRIWLTSNINPVLWYPNANEEQRAGLLRRMEVVEFTGNEGYWQE